MYILTSHCMATTTTTTRRCLTGSLPLSAEEFFIQACSRASFGTEPTAPTSLSATALSPQFWQVEFDTQAVAWQEEGLGTTCSSDPSMPPATTNKDLSGTAQSQRAQHDPYSSTVRLDISNSDSCSLVLLVHNCDQRVTACTTKLLLSSSLCSQGCVPPAHGQLSVQGRVKAMLAAGAEKGHQLIPLWGCFT